MIIIKTFLTTLVLALFLIFVFWFWYTIVVSFGIFFITLFAACLGIEYCKRVSAEKRFAALVKKNKLL